MRVIGRCQRQRMRQTAPRLCIGISQAGASGRSLIPFLRAQHFSCLFIMLGNQNRIFISPPGRSGCLTQPPGGLGMIMPPFSLEYALVSHIAQQHMDKNKLIGAFKSRFVAPINQSAVPQSVQRLLHRLILFGTVLRLAKLCHCPIPKNPPQNGCPLQRQFLVCGQTVQPGLQHPGQGCRDGQRFQPA